MTQQYTIPCVLQCRRTLCITHGLGVELGGQQHGAHPEHVLFLDSDPMDAPLHLACVQSLLLLLPGDVIRPSLCTRQHHHPLSLLQPSLPCDFLQRRRPRSAICFLNRQFDSRHCQGMLKQPSIGQRTPSQLDGECSYWTPCLWRQECIQTSMQDFTPISHDVAMFLEPYLLSTKWTHLVYRAPAQE